MNMKKEKIHNNNLKAKIEICLNNIDRNQGSNNVLQMNMIDESDEDESESDLFKRKEEKEIKYCNNEFINRKHKRSIENIEVKKLEEDDINDSNIKKQNEIIESINELLTMIQIELKKVVICRLCKRKFANKAHYVRHCSFSTLHKENLKQNLNELE